MSEAAATWSLVMGPHTINGDGYRRKSMRRLCLASLVLSCLFPGCAGNSQPTPADDLAAVRKYLDRLVSETREDTEALRAEMAATRIAAAKQEAELKELRQEVAERRQMVDARQAELDVVKTERDRLLQTKTDLHTQLQTQTAEVSRLRATAGQIEMARAKAAELESQLTSRMTELNQVKSDLAQQAALAQQLEKQAKGVSRSKQRTSVKSNTARAVSPAPDKAASKPSSPEPTSTVDGETSQSAGKPDVRVADSRRMQGPGASVLIMPGDSLYQIAIRHGVTVEQLKQTNGLTGDHIEPRQQLVIPTPKSAP